MDLDPQCSALIWFRFKNTSEVLFALFTENVSILNIISKTNVNGLEFVVSSPWLISADKALASEVGAEMILKKNLYGLNKKYWDYVLIDCPPSRVNKRTRLSKDIIYDLRRRFNGQVYETTIRESVKLAEAPSFGKPITMYDGKSSGAEDYRSLAHEIIKRRK